MERKTKIICTIGPATESLEMLKNMMNQGMNICRLNFSHEDHAVHLDRVKRIRQAAEECGKDYAILLDTKGPEIRLGDFANGKEEYVIGDIVEIVKEPVAGTKEKFHIQCPELFGDVVVGGTLLIDDGKMRLTIIETNADSMKCKVENPGVLKSKKGCNAPNVKLSMPFLSEKDAADIRFAAVNNLDYIAASFTRRKEDVLAIRSILAEENNTHTKIIAKIENQEGFDNLDDILETADGIMVARGDLGVDVSFELVPLLQKQMIKRANVFGKPVVTATHMLESMQANPRPTRAEASDVANAVLDGTDAIMLSGESAIGLYPLDAVKTMDMISIAMEKELPYAERLQTSIKTCKRDTQDAISISVAETSMALDCAGIIAFTQSGLTASRISKFRPKCPIYAVTFDKDVKRSLAATWGVKAIYSELENDYENEIELANKIAKEQGIKPGQNIIVVAGYPSKTGATNSMKIIEVE